jgi:hypothetical protein
MSGTYEDLRAWQVAMEVALEIYRATPSFIRKKRITVSRANSDERRSRLRAISPRAKATLPISNYCTS